jgi:hypothetical protein
MCTDHNCYFNYRYGGYCPQIKYRIGKTYGTDTHELAQVIKIYL